MLTRVWVVSEYWKDIGVEGKDVIAVFDDYAMAMDCCSVDFAYREVTSIVLNQYPNEMENSNATYDF